jgi:hypothetical protein
MAIPVLHRAARATLLTALAVVIASSLAPGALAAGTPGIVGSWQLTLTDPSQPAGQQTSPALVTFSADGTLINSDQPVQSTGPNSVGVPSAGHGAWVAGLGGAVALSFDELLASATGAFLGTVKVNAAVTVGATDALTGTYTVVIVGPDGTSQLASGGGSLAGTRITVGPAPAASPAA